MPEGSQPAYEIALAHSIVSDDVERSRRFAASGSAALACALLLVLLVGS